MGNLIGGQGSCEHLAGFDTSSFTKSSHRGTWKACKYCEDAGLNIVGSKSAFVANGIGLLSHRLPPACRLIGHRGRMLRVHVRLQALAVHRNVALLAQRAPPLQSNVGFPPDRMRSLAPYIHQQLRPSIDARLPLVAELYGLIFEAAELCRHVSTHTATCWAQPVIAGKFFARGKEAVIGRRPRL